ncbi:uncharacterized protein [Drosophila tropicalis]|uniref:uncharacterized protein n=1 Tax=Drosophila tropicalis TaxID=46794 RepID=UPI0035AB9F2C
MRLNQLFIWITLTALLQWSVARAQEEVEEDEQVHNAPEVSVNASEEQLPISTTEMPVIEKEREPESDHLTTDMVVEDSTTPPALPESAQEKPVEIEAVTPEIHLPAEQHSLSTVAPEEEKVTEDEHDSPAVESTDYQNEEPQPEATMPPTNPPTTIKTITVPTLPKVTSPQLPIYCFSCTSPQNGTCMRKPTKRLQCPLKQGQRNGCFTLVERNAKITMRGCLTELSEEVLTSCLADDKYCQVCYEMTCNEKDAFDATAGAAHAMWSCYLLAINFCLI